MTDRLQKTILQPRILLIVSLIAAWLLWSGLFKPLILAFGVFSCALVFVLVRRMGYFADQLFALRFSLRVLRYWIWLGGEMIKSSLDVARIILSPSLPISPDVVDIPANSWHAFEQVMLGNSITLTPGTLAMDVHDGVIRVHALTTQGARDLQSGDMTRRVNELRRV